MARNSASNPLKTVLFLFLLSAITFGQILAQRYCKVLGGNLEQVCDNHLPVTVCSTVFGESKDGKSRPERCESPYLQEEAIQCARLCRLCCERTEHACPDQAENEVSCAVKRKNQTCWKEDSLAQMVDKCPGTCGLCTRKKREWKPEMCRDQQWDCPDMKVLCPLDERVRMLCPKTCQQQWKEHSGYGEPCEMHRALYEFRFEKPPPEEDCADANNECRKGEMMSSCEKPNYYKKLADECPLSCAHCKPTGHKCVDHDAAKCLEWNSHKHRPFCHSHSFPKAVKFYWCPKTCGLC